MARLSPIEPQVHALLAVGDRKGAITLYAERYKISRRAAAKSVDLLARTPPPQFPSLPSPTVETCGLGQEQTEKDTSVTNTCPNCGTEMTYGRWGNRGGPFDNVYVGPACTRCDPRAGGRPYVPWKFSAPKVPVWLRVLALTVAVVLGPAAVFAFASGWPVTAGMVAVLFVAALVWLMRA